MDIHPAMILGLGLLVILVAWLPQVLARIALSLPIICVAIGVAIFATDAVSVDFHQLRQSHFYEGLTEAVLVISLMGAGLKIDRRIGWRRWNTTWRLIGIGMPLMIAAIIVLGVYGLALAWPAAIYLAGTLTPTDPVLASDVGVGPPGTGEEGEVRFALTSEAGLNDGLAFPVVGLGLALAAGGRVGAPWLIDGFVVKIALAVAIGWSTGWAMGWLLFRAPHKPLSGASAGLIAIGVAAVSFALTQLAGGYGFIAVFLTALALRAVAPDDDFHRAMTGFSGQIERVLLMIVLLLFGGAISGGLLRGLTWVDAAFVLALLLVVRPLSAWLATIGSPAPPVSRATMAFFGIRGIGSLYYLAYGTSHASFAEEARLRAIVGAAVLGSILIHGLASTPLMHRLDAVRKRSEREGRHPEMQELIDG